MRVRPLRLMLSLSLLLLASACATGPDRNPADPFEPANRAVFSFNDTLDRTVMTPVAKGYNTVTPSPVRTAIKNFFANLGDVNNLANDLLQGKVAAGIEDLMRLSMNTVLGIGGLIDIATPGGLPRHDQDFGLTLGHWGVASGPYLVLPLFGPNTARDAVGMAVDIQLDPSTYAASAVRNSLFGVNVVSTRAHYLDATNLLEKAALDKYSFVRDAYLGRRRSQLEGASQSQVLPDYGDDPEGANAAPAAAPAASPAPAK